MTILLILVWPRVAGPLRAVPAPVVAIVAATLLAAARPEVPRVELPDDLLAAVAAPVLPADDWAAIAGGGALTVALIASVESLLSAVAVDRMHTGPRTRVDRELVGQGPANGLSGLLGGLPVTGVIVRSSANVAAGARTRASMLNLLEGVAIGLALAGLLVLRRAVRARVRVEADAAGPRVVAEGLLSFLSVPALSRELAKLPPGAPVHVDLRVDYLDHAARDHLASWATRHRATGGERRACRDTAARPSGGAARGTHALAPPTDRAPHRAAGPVAGAVRSFSRRRTPLSPIVPRCPTP